MYGPFAGKQKEPKRKSCRFARRFVLLCWICLNIDLDLPRKASRSRLGVSKCLYFWTHRYSVALPHNLSPKSALLKMLMLAIRY